MNSTEIKDYIVAILTKTKSIDEIPIEHVEEVQEALEYLQKAKFISPGQQVKNKAKASKQANLDAKEDMQTHSGNTRGGAPSHVPDPEEKIQAEMWNKSVKHFKDAAKDKAHPDHHFTKDPSTLEDARSDHFQAQVQDYRPKKESYLKVIKMEDAGADAGVVKEDYEEVVKFDNQGQWKIEKAIKPGPTINYAEMNKPKSTENNPANTINYKEINKPKSDGKPQNTLNYGKMNSTNVGSEQTAREAKFKEKQGTMIDGSPEKDAAAKEMSARRAKIAGATTPVSTKTAMQSIAERNKKRNS